MRYRALLAYDGTAYLGFQRQATDDPAEDQQSTIQGQLELALGRLAGQPVTVSAAGRTDTGVHALGQVIAFDLDWGHDLTTLQKALNANLPADLLIRQVVEAEATFHPRFSARRRAYEYRLYHAPLRSPFHHRWSWHVSRPLALDPMNEAAGYLVGRHDFATFGRPPQGESTIREVFRAGWQRRQDYLVFEIEANAFLYRMVRSLVGSLKRVGEGAWSIEDFVAALVACDRRRAGTTAPPQGLFLLSVTY
ncbi:MAG: tRNA pseudouridine(38-40) synthase TruA [Chloroflexota bacterium]